MLVSIVERINSVDPLAVLHALHRAAVSDRGLRQLAAKGCAYWARPSEGFAIAAFGAAAVFSPSGPERFAALDHEWTSLLQHAQVDGAFGNARAVGPLLIGGFSFEPDGPRTTKWDGFPSTHMIVPEFHVTSIGDESFLTVSSMVDSRSTLRDVPAFDAVRAQLLGAASVDETRHATTDILDTSDDLASGDWQEIVANAVSGIRAGSMQKVVLARSVSGKTTDETSPLRVLEQLRSANPGAFVYGYWRNNAAFVGASPERLVRVDDRKISASSLAGTMKRGASSEADAILARQLKASEKDVAEHAAVRQMLHAALSDVADNVVSDDEPQVMQLSSIQHLHTEVTADLRNGHSILDVAARIHPTPAVGGTPRENALEFIRRNEKLDRGWSSGPIGWIDSRGGELAVALRSGLLRGSAFTLFAGCGIVEGSDPDLELAESLLKLEPMKSAIAASSAMQGKTEAMALASGEQG